MKVSPTIVFSTAAVALGGLLLGFDTAVIAGATRGMTSTFSLSSWTLGLTVACALVGTVGGGLLASPLSRRNGPRAALRWMGLLYLISALGCAFAWSWTSLLVFRFIGGLGIGGSSVLSPMYIAEIAPPKWRGRLVAGFQFAIVLGILLAYISNNAMSHLHLGQHEWRYDLGAATLPAVLFVVALFYIPESPRWLAEYGASAAAKDLPKASASNETNHPSLPVTPSAISTAPDHDALFTRKHKKVILIAISVGVLNQLTGINAILYYLNDIFAQAGFSAASANVQAIAIGAANLAFTVLAMLFIDSLGRRSLLIIGSAGMAVCLLAVSRVFSSGAHKSSLLWLLIVYIAFFAFSQGTVVWVYLSEIFPMGIREEGQSLGTLALWLTNGLVSAVFPKVAATAAQYAFLFFSLMMILLLALTIFVFPETKGISLEEASERTS